MVVVGTKKRTARGRSCFRFIGEVMLVLVMVETLCRAINSAPESFRGLEGTPIDPPLGRIVNASSTETPSRIAFITFSHLIDYSRFERFIFPALDTFLADDVYHVVLSINWKNKYYTGLCAHSVAYAQYCKRVKPIFVDCPEAKFGESPCCKQEKGLLEVLSGADRYDWYAYYDDDVYFRADKLKSFLVKFSPATVMLLTRGGPDTKRALGQPGYTGRPQYPCAMTNPNFTYPWGMPVVYSRGTLQHISRGLKAGGLVKQCREYNVTHDAGNAILHWMYSIPQLSIRMFVYPTKNDPRSFGSHGIDRSSIVRVNKVRKRVKGISMKEVHEMFLSRRDVMPGLIWHNVSGFHQTETFVQYGEPSTWMSIWHTMSTSECQGPQLGG